MNASPFTLRAGQSRGLGPGQQVQKLGHETCVQASSREIQATWSGLEREGRHVSTGFTVL